MVKVLTHTVAGIGLVLTDVLVNSELGIDVVTVPDLTEIGLIFLIQRCVADRATAQQRPTTHWPAAQSRAERSDCHSGARAIACGAGLI